MALEHPEDLESVRIMDDSVASCSNRSGIVGSAVKESENLGDDLPLLDDLNSYLRDIDDRLMISRMVSDSVIKGMVGAVEQDAADQIAQKESAISKLTEMLLSCNAFAAKNGVLECPFADRTIGVSKPPMSNLVLPNGTLEDEEIMDLLVSCKTEAGKQLTQLKECLRATESRKSIDSINSGLNLAVGFDRYVNIDSAVDGLQMMLDSFFSQVSNVVNLARSSFSKWQEEREFQTEVEATVIAVYLRSLHGEFEGVLQDQDSPVRLNERIDFLKRKKEELSSLRQELDDLNKLLAVPDASHITSHGSMEIGEEYGNGSNGKVMDHLPRKLSGSHVFPSPPWEADGKDDEVTISMPEKIDHAKLAHMSREELMEHFKTEMSRMKRNHESKVQEMTEEYYRLKREYLRDRGSSLPLKKDKDLDSLKRKIPEVILKLDEILVEIEVLLSFSSDLESLSNMKERLDAHLLENHQLSDMLVDKKRDIERLSAEVSDAGEKISGYSLAEANLREVMRKLNEEKEEVRIKATICEEVYQCFLRMLPTDMCCINNLFTVPDANKVICGNSCGEAVADVRSRSESDTEHLYMESTMSQELSGFLFVQSLKEAKEKFDNLSSECIYEKVLRACLEQIVLEQAELAKLETVENQKLKQEMLQVAASVEEKQRLAEETGCQLARERERFDQANKELEEALEKIDTCREDSRLLTHKLSLAMEELNRKEEETKLVLLDIQEKQDKILSAEMNERLYRKQMESVMKLSCGIIKSLADLENRAAVDIKRNQSRLDVLGTLINSLVRDAKLLKRWGLSYKQRLEKKTLDLEKAEKEVDLLGDEVDNLLGLLEKIYIALDHYSPIFKHYPGVMEILKLVKGELTAESLNSNIKRDDL